MAKSTKNSIYTGFFTLPKNVKNAIDECIANSDLGTQLSNLFANYIINFGEKNLLIDINKFEGTHSTEFLQKLNSTNISEYIVEKNVLSNIESDEDLETLNVASFSKNAQGFTFLLTENIATYSYDLLPKKFLTEDAASIFASNVFLKKRTIVRGFHRVVFSNDLSLSIFLIDPRILVRNETAVEKSYAVSNAIYNFLKIKAPEMTQRNSVYFFPSIKKIYEDPTAGQVTSGYFSTSAGSSFINYNSIKGIDLRKDPFQQGGEKAEKVPISFTKLTVEWPTITGTPKISLAGNSDMFLRPTQSLPEIATRFSTDLDSPVDYLVKALEYASWPT